jgi:hypothetical protein
VIGLLLVTLPPAHAHGAAKHTNICLLVWLAAAASQHCRDVLPGA